MEMILQCLQETGINVKEQLHFIQKLVLKIHVICIAMQKDLQQLVSKKLKLLNMEITGLMVG